MRQILSFHMRFCRYPNNSTTWVYNDVLVSREKKKEKDREDLWRRLESLQLNNQQLSVQKIAT